jgi:hypothetical protein
MDVFYDEVFMRHKALRALRPIRTGKPHAGSAHIAPNKYQGKKDCKSSK